MLVTSHERTKVSLIPRPVLCLQFLSSVRYTKTKVIEKCSRGRPGKEARQRVQTINRCLLSVGVVRDTKSAHDGTKCFRIKFAQCVLTNKNLTNGEVNLKRLFFPSTSRAPFISNE